MAAEITRHEDTRTVLVVEFQYVHGTGTWSCWGIYLEKEHDEAERAKKDLEGDEWKSRIVKETIHTVEITTREVLP